MRRLQSVFGHDAEDGPAIPPVGADSRISVISKSPRLRRGHHRSRSAADEFAPALKQVGGVFYQLAAPLEHVAAGIGDVLAGGFHGLAALLRAVGDLLAGVLAALRRVQDRHGRADEAPVRNQAMRVAL